MANGLPLCASVAITESKLSSLITTQLTSFKLSSSTAGNVSSGRWIGFALTSICCGG